HRFVDRNAAQTTKALTKVFATKKLHDEIRTTIFRAGVEHRDDVRALDGAHRTCLACEPGYDALIGRELGIDEFDRDAVADPKILGLIHRAHPAMTHERTENVSIRDRSTNERFASCARLLLLFIELLNHSRTRRPSLAYPEAQADFAGFRLLQRVYLR